MGVGGSEPEDLKMYQEIYQQSFYILNQTNQYLKGSDQAMFQQLFSEFNIKSAKYAWMKDIPTLMRKYYGRVLEDVNKKAVEELFRILNVVLLKQEGVGNNPENYQSKFMRKLSYQKPLLMEAINAQQVVRDSLLFEDDVILSCIPTEGDSREDNFNLFRESVLMGDSSNINQTIMKEAIFIENLNPKDQHQISFFVSFYHRFSQILEGLITNATFCSLPLRHFDLSMHEKRARKKLKTSKEITSKSSIYRNGPIGDLARQKQKYNQTLLLNEVSQFTQLYTAFIWQFYNIEKMQEKIEYATLISYENINSLVLNSVWSKVSWIGQRGLEYQELILKNYLLHEFDPKRLKKVSRQAIDICKTMSMSPMKYLKQVTLVYRQVVSKSQGTTADDILLVYDSLFFQLAKEGMLEGKLRMIEIVNNLWDGEKNGEVGYAWITWEAGLGALLHQANKFKLTQMV